MRNLSIIILILISISIGNIEDVVSNDSSVYNCDAEGLVAIDFSIDSANSVVPEEIEALKPQEEELEEIEDIPVDKTPINMQKKEDNPISVIEIKKEKPPFLDMEKQIIYFTTDNCIYCRHFDVGPAVELKNRGWGVDDKPRSFIKKMNVKLYNDDGTLSKDGQMLVSHDVMLNSYPTFILFDKYVEVDRIEGKTSAVNITDMWYRKNRVVNKVR